MVTGNSSGFQRACAKEHASNKIKSLIQSQLTRTAMPARSCRTEVPIQSTQKEPRVYTLLQKAAAPLEDGAPIPHGRRVHKRRATREYYHIRMTGRRIQPRWTCYLTIFTLSRLDGLSHQPRSQQQRCDRVPHTQVPKPGWFERAQPICIRVSLAGQGTPAPCHKCPVRLHIPICYGASALKKQVRFCKPAPAGSQEQAPGSAPPATGKWALMSARYAAGGSADGAGAVRPLPPHTRR